VGPNVSTAAESALSHSPAAGDFQIALTECGDPIRGTRRRVSTMAVSTTASVSNVVSDWAATGCLVTVRLYRRGARAEPPRRGQ
jgi:hypothetical protein